MKRILVTLALSMGLLAMSREVGAMPPDKVKFSPLPPLQELKRDANPATATLGPSGTVLPLQRSTGSQPSGFRAFAHPTLHSPSDSMPSSADTGDDSDLIELRQEIWNSQPMQVARKAVLEFCRRSAKSTVAEGEQFLRELSQLPPDQMQNWLERFEARCNRVQRGIVAEQMARQRSVERLYQRHEEQRQTAVRIAEVRGQALTANSAEQLGVVVGVGYTNPLSLYYGPTYDPFLPIFDPMSPRGYRARAAAAASLPGDLPRDDPRNFLRTDEGFISGDEPFINGVAPAPPLASPVLGPGPIVGAPAPVDVAPAVFVGPVLEE